MPEERFEQERDPELQILDLAVAQYGLAHPGLAQRAPAAWKI
jgi:hypothetical protein